MVNAFKTRDLLNDLNPINRFQKPVPPVVRYDRYADSFERFSADKKQNVGFGSDFRSKSPEQVRAQLFGDGFTPAARSPVALNDPAMAARRPDNRPAPSWLQENSPSMPKADFVASFADIENLLAS